MKLDEKFLANVMDNDVKSLIVFYKMQFDALVAQYKHTKAKPPTMKNLMFLKKIETNINSTVEELEALGY